MHKPLTPYQQHLAEQAKLDRMVHPTHWEDWIAVSCVLIVVVIAGAWIGQQVFAWATHSPTARIMMAAVE